MCHFTYSTCGSRGFARYAVGKGLYGCTYPFDKSAPPRAGVGFMHRRKDKA